MVMTVTLRNKLIERLKNATYFRLIDGALVIVENMSFSHLSKRSIPLKTKEVADKTVLENRKFTSRSFARILVARPFG
jgi:hypothetical protein